jgi:PEP-CTERM motif
VSVNFAGTAKSAVFSGQGSFIVFDNVTVNPGVVPEPASFSLLALGLAGLGVRRWHQRKA